MFVSIYICPYQYLYIYYICRYLYQSLVFSIVFDILSTWICTTSMLTVTDITCENHPIHRWKKAERTLKKGKILPLPVDFFAKNFKLQVENLISSFAWEFHDSRLNCKPKTPLPDVRLTGQPLGSHTIVTEGWRGSCGSQFGQWRTPHFFLKMSRISPISRGFLLFRSLDWKDDHYSHDHHSEM